MKDKKDDRKHTHRYTKVNYFNLIKFYDKLDCNILNGHMN